MDDTTTSRICAAPLAVACLVGLLAGTALRGSAPLVPKGPPLANVHIFDEDALILWDAATGTQHLIRRAIFRTAAPELAYVVPTPTKPSVTPARDQLFKHLDKLTAPREQVITRPRPRSSTPPPPGLLAPNLAPREEPRSVGPPPTLLADAAGVDAWMRDHDFVSRPGLADWLKDYTAGRWTFAVFRLARNPQIVRGVNTAAVRMTFKADRPFYPYSEPAHLHRVDPGFAAGTRGLRLYVVADARMQAQLPEGKTGWRGKILWANPLSAAQRRALLEEAELPADALGPDLWLTEFEDNSSPRQGVADLFFSPAVLQSTLERPLRLREEYVDREPLPPVGPGRRWLVLGGVAGLLACALAAVAFFLRRPGDAV